MCGFAGVVRARVVCRRSCAGRLARRVMAHRGPAALASAEPDARVLLVHRRLAIIDRPDRAAMATPDMPVHIVFNGEIYNYRALRSDWNHTRSVDHRQHTESLRLIARGGAEARGRAACCVRLGQQGAMSWSPATASIKPLYVAAGSGRIAFASGSARFARLRRTERQPPASSRFCSEQRSATAHVAARRGSRAPGGGGGSTAVRSAACSRMPAPYAPMVSAGDAPRPKTSGRFAPRKPPLFARHSCASGCGRARRRVPLRWHRLQARSCLRHLGRRGVPRRLQWASTMGHRRWSRRGRWPSGSARPHELRGPAKLCEIYRP